MMYNGPTVLHSAEFIRGSGDQKNPYFCRHNKWMVPSRAKRTLGGRRGESAKEAEKIGLTSERGPRPPSRGEVARHVTLIFAPTSDKSKRPVEGCKVLSFFYFPHITRIEREGRRGSQKTLAEAKES